MKTHKNTITYST